MSAQIHFNSNPKVLSLFCSIGIGETFVHDGMEFTGVDNNPEVLKWYAYRFPDAKTVLADGIEYMLEHYEEFDYIIASPPCQAYSVSVVHTNLVKEPDMEYVDFVVKFLEEKFDGKWFVENVDSPTLRFRIPKFHKIDRHLFWSNDNLSGISFHKPKWFDFMMGTKERMRDGMSRTESYLLDLCEWYEIEPLPERIYIRGNHNYTQVYREGIHPTIVEKIFYKFTTGKIKGDKTVDPFDI